MSDYWIEKESGQSRTLQYWRREWESAVYYDELERWGWPDSWRQFVKTCLVLDDGTFPKIRKRKPGGGRKPNLDKMIIKQICLTREQGEAVKLAAKAAGRSQSAWIREAVMARLVS